MKLISAMHWRQTQQQYTTQRSNRSQTKQYHNSNAQYQKAGQQIITDHFLKLRVTLE